MTVTSTKQGGRKIELFLPFRYGSKRITVVTLRPVRWDQSLRWQEGSYKTATDLLFEMADLPEDVMREIRYPDVERVLMAFMDLLPPEIRSNVAAGEIPQVMPVQPTVTEDAAPVEEPKPPETSGNYEYGGELKDGEPKPWPEYPYPPGTPVPTPAPQPATKPPPAPTAAQPADIGFQL